MKVDEEKIVIMSQKTTAVTRNVLCSVADESV